MRKELMEIIDNYKKFKDYVDNLDLSIYEECSKEELSQFIKDIHNVEVKRYITMDANEVISKKRLIEFPELLQVHRYPILKKIDFLTENDKIKLDKFLGSMSMSEYFGHSRWQWIEFLSEFETNDDELEENILRFLLENDVVIKKHDVKFCCDTMTMTEEELKALIRYLELKEKTLEKNEYDEYIHLEEKCENYMYCEECGEDTNLKYNEISKKLNEPLSRCFFKKKVPSKSIDG